MSHPKFNISPDRKTKKNKSKNKKKHFQKKKKQQNSISAIPRSDQKSNLNGKDLLKHDINDYKANGWEQLPNQYFNRNSKHDNYTIDLHHLTRKAAVIELLKRFEILKPGESLKVIVGRGLSNKNKKSILGEHIQDYLTQCNVKFQLDLKSKGGALIVIIPTIEVK